MIDRVLELVGCGNIQETQKGRNLKLYRFNALSDNARMILREVYPYMVTKKNQAKCALYCPTNGAEAEECWQNIKKMHHQELPTREYPEPKVGGVDPWILRNSIVWWKPNCIPSSVKDRFTVDYEMLFFFTKSKKYYFETQYEPAETNLPIVKKKQIGLSQTHDKDPWGSMGYSNGGTGRNKRCVWVITTKPYSEAHFATYPEDLCETPIKAGCPEFVCKKCGKAREKIKEIIKNNPEFNQVKGNDTANIHFGGVRLTNNGTTPHFEPPTIIDKGYTDCGCNAGWEGGIVLDPFFGAGTTGLVALKQNKKFIGIELNPEYVTIAKNRLKPFLEQQKFALQSKEQENLIQTIGKEVKQESAEAQHSSHALTGEVFKN